MLMLLGSGQRGQTLHLLDIRNMIVSNSKVSLRIGHLLNTFRPGNHLSELVFEAFPFLVSQVNFFFFVQWLFVSSNLSKGLT